MIKRQIDIWTARKKLTKGEWVGQDELTGPSYLVFVKVHEDIEAGQDSYVGDDGELYLFEQGKLLRGLG